MANTYSHKTYRVTARPRNGRLLDALPEGGQTVNGGGQSAPSLWVLNSVPGNNKTILVPSQDVDAVASMGDVIAYHTEDNSIPDIEFPVATYTQKGILSVKAGSALRISGGVLDIDPDAIGGLDIEKLEAYLKEHKYATQDWVAASYLTLASTLKGYSIANAYTPITANDTILTAFGKLEKNFSNYVNLTTDQTIGGNKTFNGLIVGKKDIVCYSTGDTPDVQFPIASATQLGVIKVGKNLTIGSDGTLNAEAGGITSVNWGDIKGALADQEDLWGTLNGKAEKVHTHTIASITDIGNANVASASKLKTARKLWGNSFDGTADVNGIIHFYEDTFQIYNTPKAIPWLLYASNNSYINAGNGNIYIGARATNEIWFYGGNTTTTDWGISLGRWTQKGLVIGGTNTAFIKEKLNVNGSVYIDQYIRMNNAYYGSSWGKGEGLISAGIQDNPSQTPLIVTYREGASLPATGTNRLFSLELLNNGSQIGLVFGGSLTYDIKSNGDFISKRGNLFAMKDVVAYAVGDTPDLQLPIASKTTLGLIKIGANLSITSDGTLSALPQGLTSVSWEDVKNKPTTFTPSVHTHDYILSRDTRDVNNTPIQFDASFRAEFKNNSTDGLSDGGLYHGILHFRPYGTGSDTSGGNTFQLAFTDNLKLWLRRGKSAWSAWKQIAFITDKISDSDKLDGLHSSAFARADQNSQVDLNTVNGRGIMNNPWDEIATPERHYPMKEAGALFYGTGAYNRACQVYGTYKTNRWFARGGGLDVSPFTSWSEFAFLNRDVSFGKITMGSELRLNNAATFYLGSLSEYMKIQSYGGKKLVINPEGNNVGIRTTDPIYQLHVNGTFGVSDSSYMRSIYPYSDNSYNLGSSSKRFGRLFLSWQGGSWGSNKDVAAVFVNSNRDSSYNSSAYMPLVGWKNCMGRTFSLGGLDITDSVGDQTFGLYGFEVGASSPSYSLILNRKGEVKCSGRFIAGENVLANKDVICYSTGSGSDVQLQVSWNDITGKPSAFTPVSHTHPWDQVTGKPSTFAPSAHTHSWDQITGKPSGTWNGGTVSNNITIRNGGVVGLSLDGYAGKWQAAFIQLHNTYLTGVGRTWQNDLGGSSYGSGDLYWQCSDKNGNGSAHNAPWFRVKFYKGSTADGVCIGAQGSVANQSDMRLKDKVRDIPNMLSKINKLSAFYYTWKDDLKKNINIGVSAQEVQAVFPELVYSLAKSKDLKSINDGDDILGVDYATLGAVVAIQGIKELYTQHTSLSNKVSILISWKSQKDKQIDFLIRENANLKERVKVLEEGK